MNEIDDDEWLNVLSGHSSASKDTDSALMLRSYFSNRTSTEMAYFEDEARERQLLSRIQKSLIAQQPKKAGWWSAWVKTFRSVTQGLASLQSGWQFTATAATAAALVAFVAVPVLIGGDQQDIDGPGWKSTTSNTGRLLMIVKEPDRVSEQLRNMIQESGLQPTVQNDNGKFLIEAKLPDGKRADIQRALMPYGLVLPAGGDLVILVTDK